MRSTLKYRGVYHLGRTGRFGSQIRHSRKQVLHLSTPSPPTLIPSPFRFYIDMLPTYCCPSRLWLHNI